MSVLEILRDVRDTDRIKVVNFSFKDIEIAHVQSLAEALKVNTSVTHLHLSGVHLGAQGTRVICDALKVNTSVTHVHLYSNNMGSEGADAIAELLQVNHVITHVYMYDNAIGCDGAFSLAKGLVENYTLQYLNVSENDIELRGFEALSDALSINGSVLRCVGCDVTANEWCEKNKCMRRLAQSSCEMLMAIRRRRVAMWEAPKEVVAMIAKYLWETKTDSVGWNKKEIKI